ncbi:MAG: PAS domain S-box protein [Candidatus Obscuribacterales bacterium]|nr:PAS domain S-box protein [Candidatus Obscuribacterales bacterium]
MIASLNLKQQGWILVGVPIGMMLVFLLSLFFFYLRVEEDLRRAERARTVMSLCNKLTKEFALAGTTLVLYKLREDADAPAKLEAQLTATHETLEKLDNLLREDPIDEELELLKHTHDYADTAAKLIRIYKKKISGEYDLPEGQARIIFLQFAQMIPKFTHRLERIGEIESHRLNQYEQSGKEGSTQLKVFIATGALFAVAIGVVLTIGFNRNTTRRLGILMDNTERLSKKQSLQLLTAESGSQLDLFFREHTRHDEIAQLDLFFRKMANELAEATRKERAILDNAVDVICSINSDGKFTAVNPASSQVWGIAPEKLIGMHYSEIIEKDDVPKFAEAIENQTKQQSNSLLNIENKVTVDEHPVHTLWSIRWSESEQSLFCVAHDISDRKEVERMKQEFVAVISHELRTPLTSLQMTLSLLLNGNYGPISETAEQRVKSADVGVTRLIMLVSDLLDIEKMEAGKLQMRKSDSDLAEVIERSIETMSGFAAQQGVQLTDKTGGKSVPVHADPDRLLQVVVNLLSNAIKYSEEGGQIEIELTSNSEHAELQVVDHGAGIPPEFEETLFKKYEQAKAAKNKKLRSSGLGLAISKAIIEQHDGVIGFSRTEGGGSTFWFRLPVLAAAQKIAIKDHLAQS